ncbi:chorismate synthase, chloroplastic-like [Hibiscus syriacus]|uniref:chorismate synthase, chloroplastic-like n=1 Tax=Hibiscus syriacus TaxID=106335 RepID=UPI0019245A8D|nr:chorismate synthase, chloroplastic-like [Hibiscus syriacus]
MKSNRAILRLFLQETSFCLLDYKEMTMAYRPSHADFTYDTKYGVREVQGGGRSSARETIGRVIPGAIAKKILKQFSGTEVLAYVSQVHQVVLPDGLVDHDTVTLDQIENSIVRCPNPEYTEKMMVAIDAVRARGDSIGGVLTCIVKMSHTGLVHRFSISSRPSLRL